MKFFVVVNHNHLVVVDAETNGGAEHKLLDKFYYYVNQCQAFKINETAIMFEMFPDVQTTSFEHLQVWNMKAEINHHLVKAAEHKERAEELGKKLESMKV